MRTLSQEDDPNEERVQIDGTACMPKRGLIDRIPKVLTIDVTTASSVAMVNELSAVREHGVPQPTPEQMPFYDLWHRFHLPHQVHCTALCLLSHGDCMN